MNKTLIFILTAISAFFLSSCSSNCPSCPEQEPVFMVEFQNGIEPSAAYSNTYDSMISSLLPDDTYGTSPIFRAGYYINATLRSLVMFILQDIPPGAVIKAAYLQLMAVGVTDSSDKTFSAHNITSYWTPSTVTWNTCPSYDETAMGSAAPLAASNFVTLQVPAAAVQAWLDNPASNYGLLLKHTNETPASGSNSVDFASANTSLQADYKPKLTVYYSLE